MNDNNEEVVMNDLIEELYQDYIEGGFDFSTDDSFDDVFKRLFFAGAEAVINMIEENEE
jgi:hypothetical protein